MNPHDSTDTSSSDSIDTETDSDAIGYDTGNTSVPTPTFSGDEASETLPTRTVSWNTDTTHRLILRAYDTNSDATGRLACSECGEAIEMVNRRGVCGCREPPAEWIAPTLETRSERADGPGGEQGQ